MQAGLVSKRLSFREVFMTDQQRILFVIIFIYIKAALSRVREQKMAAQQQ
jgi:hypothetical protein